MKVYFFPGSSSALDNPYLRLLTSSLRDVGVDVRTYKPFSLVQRGAILHINWPERLWLGGVRSKFFITRFLAVLFFLMNATYAKFAGGKVVITMHNLESHERDCTIFGDFYTKLVQKQVTDVILMSESHMDQCLKVFETNDDRKIPRFKVIPHFHYAEAFDYSLVHEDRKVGKDISDIIEANCSKGIYCAVGQIRAYKGLGELISIFKEVANKDEVLLIAGSCADEMMKDDLLSVAAEEIGVRIFFVIRPLKDSEIGYIHKKSTAAIFNLLKITNSGSLMASVTCGTPIVTNKNNAVADLRLQVPEYPVFEFGNLSEFRSALDSAKLNNIVGVPPEKISPKNVAKMHREVYSL